MKMAALLLAAAAAAVSTTPDIPFRWDELVASDWPAALERSARTCVLPIGTLENPAPHPPSASALIRAREISARAAKQEYAAVFPDYFYGQINEARQQPGAFALPPSVVWDLM